MMKPGLDSCALLSFRGPTGGRAPTHQMTRLTSSICTFCLKKNLIHITKSLL